MSGRRDFLKTVAGAVAAGFPAIVPSSAFGRDGAVAPGDRITVACIGTGWQAGPETPAEAGRIVAAIKAAAAEAGRSIDDDHYGASFPYHFGRSAQPTLQRAMEAYAKRTGNDANGYFAVGDAGVIVERISEYVAAGVSKFVLRPMGAGGEEVLAQTRQLIEQVLPLVATRWPRPVKVAAQ